MYTCICYPMVNTVDTRQENKLYVEKDRDNVFPLNGNNVAWESLIQKIKCKRLIEGHTKFVSVFF